MKKALVIITVVLLSATACDRPKTIPDRKLPLIVRDLIVANAYSARSVPGISSDTIDIYTPILEKYGYTDADLRNTLNRMAMKKSSRFSEIMDSAIAEIRREDDYFKWRKSVRNKIDSLATARYKDTVYVMDTAEIVVKSITQKDADNKYVIRIPVVGKGDYQFDMKYIIDTVDKKNYYMFGYHFETWDSTRIRPGTLSYSRSNNVKRRMSVKITPTASDSTLVIKLLNYNKNFTKPINITFDSIYIVYYPPVEESRERMAREVTYSFFKKHAEDEARQKDSGALYLVPPLRPDTTGRADILR